MSRAEIGYRDTLSRVSTTGGTINGDNDGMELTDQLMIDDPHS